MAAHIKAAAPGGPRYDPSQPQEERRSINNGIWLCQNCSKKIDSDIVTYTVDLLLAWKDEAEQKARVELGMGMGTQGQGAPLAPTSVQGPAGAALTIAVTEQLLGLQRELATGIAQWIDAALNRIRAGQRRTVEQELAALQSNPIRWAALQSEQKARALRLLASCHLIRGDFQGAENLADAADALAAPTGEPRLRALTALRRSGPDAALRVLGDVASIDGINLKLGLLIDSGDLPEARKLLDACLARDGPDAETWRLNAWLALAEDNREAALSAIRRAEALAPGWLSIQQAGGIVRYVVAMSHAVPAQSLLSPNPVDPDLVLPDALSSVMLNDAEQCFSRCLAHLEDDRDNQQLLETWRLASLCCNRRRIDAAAAYAEELLHGDRTHWGAIAWSLALGFPLDAARAGRALGDLLDAGRGNATHLATALLLELIRDRPDKARRLYDRHAEKLRADDSSPLLDYWGERLKAEETDGAAGLMPVKLSRSLQDAQETGCWESVSALLEELATDPVSLPLLLPACQSLAVHGRWRLIEPYIDMLAERFATTAAVGLASEAAVLSGRARRAVEIIDRFVAAIGQTAIPLKLKRLRAEARLQAGDIRPALIDFQSLHQESADPRDLIRLAQLGAQVGDMDLIVQTLRNERAVSALEADETVKWVGIVAPHEPRLATDLLEHAIAKGLPDAVVPVAFLRSLNLAADSLAARLAPDLARLANGSGNSPVRAVGLDEMVQIIRKDRETAEELGRMHADCALGLHLLAQRIGAGFAALLSRTGEAEAWPKEQPPAFVRWGGRPPEGVKVPKILKEQLVLDVSAVLLADAVGVLDVLERARVCLHVPRALPPTLLQLENQARERQPDYATAKEVVQRAAKTGRVAVHDEAVLGTPQTYLVVHRLETLGAASSASVDAAVTVHAVVEALSALGRITEEQYAIARQRMGERAQTNGLIPGADDSLLFEYNTLEVLAHAGLLDAVVSAFRASVESRYLNDVRAEAAAWEERLRLADRLGRLRNRVNSRLEKGAWSFLLPSALQTEDMEDLLDLSGPEQCLVELLSISSTEPAILWIDDRWVNQYPQSEAHPIVGILDVLAALRASGHLTEAEHYGILLRLRRGRVHFLPPTASEILYHLSSTSVGEDELIETAELRTIRCHFADALLLEPHWSIQHITSSGDNDRELPMVLQMTRVLREVLIGIWEDPGVSDKVRVARSDWAIAALRADRFQRIPLAGGMDAARSFQTQILAFTLTTAFSLFSLRDIHRRTRCKAFLEWFEARVLDPAQAANPMFVKDASVVVKQLLLSEDGSDDPESRGTQHVWKAYLASFIDILPEPVRQHLVADQEVANAIGIAITTVINFANVTVDAEGFWQAVAKASLGASASVQTTDGKAVLNLEPAPGGNAGGILLTGAHQGRLEPDPAFALLVGASEQWYELLVTHREWLDLRGDEREDAIAAIVSADTPSGRMRLLDDRRSRSIPWRQRQWRQDLDSKEGVNFAPPSALDLVCYLRISGGDELSFWLSKAADVLVAELGPVEAVRRLGGLPVPPQPTVVGAFSAMAAPEREAALAKLAVEIRGPVGRVHVLSLMRALGHSGLSREIDVLLAEWPETGDVFVAVLQWALTVFVTDSEWRAMAGPLRLLLVWAHAHLVTDTLLTAGVSPQSIIKYFGSVKRRLPLSQYLVSEADFVECVLYPGPLFTSATLLYHGLAGIVGEEGALILSAPQRQNSEALVCRMRDGQRQLGPELLRDARVLADPFHSYLAQRPVGIFETIPEVGWGQLDDFEESLGADFEDPDPARHTWLVAEVVGPGADQPPERLLAAVHKLEISSLLASEKEGALTIRAAAAMAARCPQPDASETLLDKLAQAASEMSAKHPAAVHSSVRLPIEDTHPARAAYELLEILAILSRRATLDDAAQFFAHGLERLAVAWPSAMPLWRHTARSVIDELPFTPAGPLWKLWVSLRALP